MSMLAGDLWILSSYISDRGGAVLRDAPAGSANHRLRRHCDTPRRLRDDSAHHPATLGCNPRATTVAAVPEGRALYSRVVQLRGERRPAAEVFCL